MELTFHKFILNLATAILILVLGLIFGSVGKKIVKRLLEEFEIGKILKKEGVKLNVVDFFAESFKYVIYFIAIIWALTEIGLSTIVFQIILGLILTMLVVFLVLAFKDFIPNVTAGLFMQQKGLIKKGYIIKMDSIEGKVIAITLTETKIKTEKGELILIPNSLLTKKEIKILKK